MLSNWIIFKVMREAGLPPGVVNFVPADGPVFGDTIVKVNIFATSGGHSQTTSEKVTKRRPPKTYTNAEIVCECLLKRF